MGKFGFLFSAHFYIGAIAGIVATLILWNGVCSHQSVWIHEVGGRRYLEMWWKGNPYYMTKIQKVPEDHKIELREPRVAGLKKRQK